MVNYEDPVVVELDIDAVKGLWHTISGIYIWEFITALDYEWNIIRGRRPYRWTIWLYSLTRLACLGAVVLLFVGMDVTTPYNCHVCAESHLFLVCTLTDYDPKAWIVSGLSLGYVTIAASSLLIVFRIIAIWNRNKVAVAIATAVRAAWVPGQQSCIAYNIGTSELNIIATLITDVALLFIALVGLFRMRLQEGGAFGIGRLLWTQGVIWFVLTTAAGVPPAVFIILDLNYPFNVMFQPLTVIVMGISAQRLYRGLADFVSASTDVHVPNSGNNQVSKIKWNHHTVSAPFEVAVNTQQYSMPQTSQYGSYSSTDEQSGPKTHELNLENKQESTIGTPIAV
ncbi:hypothetical protein BJV74DRAFT_886143 [Russula compacta]|nr:hypothetical protein BJV74DRAFT_886143 [Russula compacta]